MAEWLWDRLRGVWNQLIKVDPTLARLEELQNVLDDTQNVDHGQQGEREGQEEHHLMGLEEGFEVEKKMDDELHTMETRLKRIEQEVGVSFLSTFISSSSPPHYISSISLEWYTLGMAARRCEMVCIDTDDWAVPISDDAIIEHYACGHVRCSFGVETLSKGRMVCSPHWNMVKRVRLGSRQGFISHSSDETNPHALYTCIPEHFTKILATLLILTVITI